MNARRGGRRAQVAVGALGVITLGSGVWAVDGVRAEQGARDAAVEGFEAQSGLRNVDVVRSFVSGGCAVVELQHPAMPHGVTSVALTRQSGHWQVRLIQDEDKGISFDPDDAEGQGCRDIIKTGGHR